MKNLQTAISDLSKTLSEDRGIESVENALFEIIDTVRNSDEQKVYFLKYIKRSFTHRDPSGLFEGGVPRELIELATHELKWPELAILADERIQALFNGDERLAIGDVSEGVKKAYAEDWEDREFYQRYIA